MATSNKRSTYWRRQKHLTDPTTDVICIVALVIVLLLAGYMHVSMGL